MTEREIIGSRPLAVCSLRPIILRSVTLRMSFGLLVRHRIAIWCTSVCPRYKFLNGLPGQSFFVKQMFILRRCFASETPWAFGHIFLRYCQMLWTGKSKILHISYAASSTNMPSLQKDPLITFGSSL